MSQLLTVEQIPTVRRDLKILDATLFAFSISLNGMSKTISINWNKFGFSKEGLELLKRSRVKLSNIPVFAKLNDYALELNRLRTSIEERTLFVAEQRVVTQNQINLALAEYHELSLRANHLREQLKVEYEAGKDEFRSRITSLLATPEFKIPEDEQLARVDEICSSFVSREAINNLLRPELKVRRIPSLSEQLQEQTRLKTELTNLKQAQRQAQSEAALAEAQEQSIARARSLREDIFAKAKAEIETIIAEQIEAISEYEVEEPETNVQRKINAHYKRNRKVREKMAKHLKRMEVLFEIGKESSVGSAIERLETAHEAMNKSSKADLENTLANLQQQLKDDLKQIASPDEQLLEVTPSLI